jgi:hypothetical protein
MERLGVEQQSIEVKQAGGGPGHGPIFEHRGPGSRAGFGQGTRAGKKAAPWRLASGSLASNNA